MKKWPTDDTETVSFTNLIDPIIKSIEFGYEMKRRNKNRNIPYKGYNTEMEENSACFDPVETFRVRNLQYSEKEQGRSLLDEAIGIVFRLGMAQGRRMYRNKMKSGMKLMECAIKNLDMSKESRESLMAYFEIIKGQYESLQTFSKKKFDKNLNEIKNRF
jgi:hypothetical protein